MIARETSIKMRAILLGAAVCLAAQVSALDCPPGTYFHDRGSFDCDPKCDKSNPTPACCCTCGIGFFCPGETAVQAEEPCFEGMTSPPGSTSLFNCTGPTPAIGQIHIAYTGVPGQFSVDFVSSVDSASAVSAFVYTSADNATWSAASATTFAIPTIGVLAQALLSWPGVVAGQRVHYKARVYTPMTLKDPHRLFLSCRWREFRASSHFSPRRVSFILIPMRAGRHGDGQFLGVRGGAHPQGL